MSDENVPDKDDWPNKRKRPPGAGEPQGTDSLLPVVYRDFVEGCRADDEARRRYALDPPCVLDEQRCQSILAMLAQGIYLDTACVAAGVDRKSFYNWKRKWKDKEDSAVKVAWFFEKIPQAVAMAQVACFMNLNQAKGDWTRYAWQMERRHNKPTWGRGKKRWLPPALQMDREEVAALEPPKPLDQMTDEEFAQHEAEVLEHAKPKRGRPKATPTHSD